MIVCHANAPIANHPSGIANVNKLEYWKLKTKASSLVNRAVQSGSLPSPKTLVCFDCGKHAAVYDHRDYHKPLEVVPVCSSCNRKRGMANHEVTNEPVRRIILVLECQRCKHEWIPRKQPVRQCPKCKTLDFDKPSKRNAS